ncbi:hypothetical protein [Aurantiacibacter zhengii]|nr:hypothetical protein [Aurantiacibacter zhengii]
MFQEEHALAKAAYDDFDSGPVREGGKPDGRILFEEVTSEKDLKDLGILPSQLKPTDSDFRARVMKRPGSDEYFVTFKGTTSWFGQDTVANVGQAITGDASYYTNAKNIAIGINDKLRLSGGGSVKFVGHSLGGGLASAAAHATGAPATTFNAAGLHDKNLRPEDALYNIPPIDAVRVDGEILTSAQNLLGSAKLIPEAAGTPFRLKPPGGVGGLFDYAKIAAMAPFVPPGLRVGFAAAALARSGYLHTGDAIDGALDGKFGEVEDRRLRGGCEC